MPIFNTEYKSYKEWWQPWANTILYMPLDSTNTTTDLSSNHNDWTINWTVNFWTNLWVDCGAFLNSGYITIPYSSSMATSNITISCWCAIVSWYSSNNWWIIAKTALTWWHWAYHIANMNNLRFNINQDSATVIWNGFSGNNVWTNIVWTYDGTTLKLYSNNSFLGDTSYTYNISGDTNQLVLWAYYSSTYKMNWYLSKVIVENKVWTADEISEYYNWTKWNYWL